MNLLEVQNIQKKFGDLEVLKDISLAVEENEVISILGPSGSGKSTFLRCMTMLETVDGGSITYCGKQAVNSDSGKPVYADKKTMKEIQGYYGLVFQNFQLFPHYSVKMNLADKGDCYPYQLSGGQQQRVAIARALALNPKMLFFDEPTSALDPELTSEILKVLRELAQEKMTMVIVTHEIDFARSISDRVIFMDGGVIVEQGRPQDVIDNPKTDRAKAFLKKIGGQ